MTYNIVLTTAEDIVGVVDAVLAKNENCDILFIHEFADISEVQAKNALDMAIELNLITIDNNTMRYSSNSLLARLLVSARNNQHKATIMRFILEQYKPFITFKARYNFSQSIDLASKQVKHLYTMTSSYKDIKNTLTNIATYAKAMLSDGASQYIFNDDSVSYIEILDVVLKSKANDDYALRTLLGEEVYNFVDEEKVYAPLSDAFGKIQNELSDGKTIILYAGNAFESFLKQIADKHQISLTGKNGIIQKSSALSSVISKKHRGMIDYIGQVRNAADHGADVDEGGGVWEISEETSRVFPTIIATIIKDIVLREKGNLYV
ncbi:hypothetical protein CS063_13245 [Sporanaerobium hydrogeniformans]|uniref:Uncharacterized protein n=1 Tax=Sporanaerobium hydrogeniformans TaxID=3072179 RepID=A0AC61DB26_9FIRM|nr:hypothetical protein [Sporanaerobium hydrogeniformans]PHV69943.1 hypothetical protein CS063_13245 [Sporanaerobium hydrogeniformans]